jgi:propionyl-CoA carboxylase alpha chain
LKQCTLDNTIKLHVADTFNNNDQIIHTKANDKKLTMQLISISPSGDINMQYMGTHYKLKLYTEQSFDKLKYMLPKKEIDLSSLILSPMPGIVKSISVKPGDQVIEGQEICIVEAMKMQNKLVANKTGKVNLILFNFHLIRLIVNLISFYLNRLRV